MSIVTKQFYNLRCDICGELYDEQYWDEDEAFNNAEVEGWLRNYDGKDICPECWKYDDNDNYVIKENHDTDN